MGTASASTRISKQFREEEHFNFRVQGKPGGMVVADMNARVLQDVG